MTKRLTAYVTLVRPFSGMSPFMSCQVAWLTKCFITQVTLVQPTLSMSSLVGSQFAILGMNPLMDSQFDRGNKCFTAPVTLIWFPSSMTTLVVCQVRQLFEFVENKVMRPVWTQIRRRAFHAPSDQGPHCSLLSSMFLAYISKQNASGVQESHDINMSSADHDCCCP